MQCDRRQGKDSLQTPHSEALDLISNTLRTITY